jgi:hypothetical protein
VVLRMVSDADRRPSASATALADSEQKRRPTRWAALLHFMTDQPDGWLSRRLKGVPGDWRLFAVASR